MTLPLLPIMGGLLIGTSSLLLLISMGRVAGISGIFWSVIAGPDRGWRACFLLGLLLGGAAAHGLFGLPVPASQAASLYLAVLAGVLVGSGTRLGSGCTSGHGVCGIARRSQRSMVATGVFMASGIAMVFLTRHVLEITL
jgi:uncharacterized membrane protein YedE/YeeE